MGCVVLLWGNDLRAAWGMRWDGVLMGWAGLAERRAGWVQG